MTIETANRLYELRKQHNLSQEELAEKLGVSRQAVSKWERSEASPDTDNLIALAKIYGLSLDELIYGATENNEEKKDSEEKDDNTAEASEKAEKININLNEICIESDDGDKIKIGPSGILVESDDGDKVKVGISGIHIENFEDGEKKHIFVKDDKNKKTKFWLEIPYAVICVVAYLIFGFTGLCGGWALSWIIFLTIPIYYSLVEAIYKRKFTEFAYPVLTAFVYLYLGLYHGNWHPSWIIFITVAIYYPIAEAIDRKIRERAQAKAEQ